MAQSKRICVYCGSSDGGSPRFAAAANGLGRSLVAHGYDLVYGGASIGLMGRVADAVLDGGGRAYGVLPKSLVPYEIAHEGLTELFVAASMHERKAKMAELSDGFVVLPGGLGTLDEFFEMWTWSQLGFHAKPIGVLNVDGYFDDLVSFLDRTVAAGFVKQPHHAAVRFESDVDALLAGFV